MEMLSAFLTNNFWLQLINVGVLYQHLDQVPFSNVSTSYRLGVLGRTLGYVRFSTDDFRLRLVLFWKVIPHLAFVFIHLKITSHWYEIPKILERYLPTTLLIATPTHFMLCSPTIQVALCFDIKHLSCCPILIEWILWKIVHHKIMPISFFFSRPALSRQANWWTGWKAALS